MCNNVKSSVRLQLCFHLADTYFQLLSIFVSPSLSLSAFHHFIVHLHSFIVPLCTSHLFQCFITARLTSSSTPFFPHTHTNVKFVCFQCTCFFPELVLFVSSLLVPTFSIPSIYSPLTVRQLIAAVYFPAFVCLIRMSVAARVCLTRAQWLSELTAHKRAVIPCVKDCYWHGPFNLTLSKLCVPSCPPHLYSHPFFTHIFIHPQAS